jgi:hypothetical protein
MDRTFAGQVFVAVNSDPKEWARRYDIEPFTHPCHCCGAELTTTIPIASRTLRGMSAPNCDCGNARPPICLVAAPGHDDLLIQLKGGE